jgi:hypothetical protein
MLSFGSEPLSSHGLCQKPILSWNRPAIFKDPFTPEEDNLISGFVREHGPQNWNVVAAQLKMRTPKQCRERWHNHLDPAIDRRPWTYEEDLILATKQATLGNRWAEISRYLPGRTDTLVKNRWVTWLKPRLLYDRQGHVTLNPDCDLYEKNDAKHSSPIPPPSMCKIEFMAWLDQFTSGGTPPPQAIGVDWIPPLAMRPTG